jgi:hypothetical protein
MKFQSERNKRRKMQRFARKMEKKGMVFALHMREFIEGRETPEKISKILENKSIGVVDQQLIDSAREEHPDFFYLSWAKRQ